MTRNRPTLVYAMFVVVLVLAALDQTILSTALPAIARDLDGQARIAWVFSAYLIASTVVIPLYGKLADIHGSKPVLLAAIGLFLCGSLGCGFAASMNQLIVARAVQGAGGGGLMTLTMLAVVDLYPAQVRGRYQSLLGAAYGVATMFGPLIGGLLVQHLSWHWAFFLNVPLALFALGVLQVAFRPVSARHPQTVDYAGAGLLAAALFTLLIATRREVGFDPWLIWSLAASGALLAVAFLWNERRARHPLLPLSLFSSRVFSAATAVSAATGVALFAAVVFLPLYLQTALGKTPTASALYLLPLMSGVTLAAIIGGKVLRAGGPVRALALAASGVMVLSFAALAVTFRFLAHEPLLMSACLLPLGAGIGLLLPLVTVLSQRAAPPQQMGVATATPIMVRSLGGAVGVSVLGLLLAHGIAAQIGPAATSASLRAADQFGQVFAVALQPVYGSVAAVCVVAAIAAWLLPKRLASPAAPVQTPPAASVQTMTRLPVAQ